MATRHGFVSLCKQHWVSSRQSVTSGVRRLLWDHVARQTDTICVCYTSVFYKFYGVQDMVCSAVVDQWKWNHLKEYNVQKLLPVDLTDKCSWCPHKESSLSLLFLLCESECVFLLSWGLFPLSIWLSGILITNDRAAFDGETPKAWCF